MALLSVILAFAPGASAPSDAFAACPGKGTKLGDLNSTSSMIQWPRSPSTTTPLPGGGSCGLTSPGFPNGLTLSDGVIGGDFNFTLSWTGACDVGQLNIYLTNADQSKKYKIGTTGPGGVTSPHNGPVTCSGSLGGLKSTLGSDTLLSDVWVCVYFKCLYPSTPEVLIWKAHFK